MVGVYVYLIKWPLSELREYVVERTLGVSRSLH